MPTRRSWLRRVVLGVGVVVALLVAAVAAVPFLVDVDRVRHAVERRISDVTGGEVRYDSLVVRLFPQPRAEIRNATIRFPGAVAGRIGTLEIRIALLPLLAGHVRPGAVNVVRPVLDLTIEPGGARGEPFAAYRAALGPAVDALVRWAPGMSLGISDGTLDVRYAGQRIVSLSRLALDARVAADAIEADVSGAADLWRTASLRLKIVPGSLAATSRLHVSGLRLAEVLQVARLQAEVRVLAEAIDATLDAETDGHESARAGLVATAPDLTLVRGARTLELGAMRVALDASRDGTAMTVSLRGLQLGEYLPAATGALRGKPDATALSVELQVPALDLARLRAAALALAGDLGAVQSAAAWVTAGALQSVTIGAAGSDVVSLAALGSVRAEARLASAALDFPTLGIAIANGAGRFVLADGTLRGSELSGVTDRSSIKGGTLRLELAPAVVLRVFEGVVDTDLGEALALARRAIGRPEPAALADVESLEGRATGTVAYEGRRGGPRVVGEVATLQATARYRNVPLPIVIAGAQVGYAPDRLTVGGLHGAFGRSSIQGGALELALGPEPAVRAARGDAVVVLDELYPWLTSLDGLERPASEIPTATGTVAVHLARLSGPVNTPEVLEYEAVLRPQAVRFAGPRLPGPVTLTGGELRSTPRSIALERVEVSLLDARVVATGSVQEYTSTAPRFDLALADGTAGERMLDWVRSRWGVPVAAMPRAPLTLASGRVQGTGGAGVPLTAQGSVGLAGGVRAEFDLASQPGHLDLRRLAVKDPDTDAQATLEWTASSAELGFRGKLDHATLARVLVEPPAREGALRGDFHATIDLTEPWHSSASGALEGHRIDILERWGIPVAIERLRIDAAGDAVQIHEGAVVLAGERLALTGSVTRRRKTLGLDLSVTADAVDAERLLHAFPHGGGQPAGAAWNLPVDGRIAVDAKSVAYGKRAVGPVSGTVDLAPDHIVANVTEVRLCGVALPLNAVLVPGNVTVTSRIDVRAQPLAGTVACLLGEHLAMTGTLDLRADLSADGPADAVARTARGTFQLTARDGQVENAPLIARILSLEAVAARLRARPSELMANGLDYSELAVAGAFDAGRLRIASSTLTAEVLGLAMAGEIDLAAGQLDMQGVVAPFGGIRGTMRYVPILGRIFGSRAVGIPLRVRGDLRDPQVVPLGPAAIGQSMVNMLSGMMKAPVELLDPFVGRQPAP